MPSNVKIALVVKSLGNGFFDAANKGAQEAAKELGDVEIIYTGPTKATAEGQIEVINSLIAQKVNAIAISANDADALVPALKKAMERGITVISWDSGVAPEGRQMHLNPSDTNLIGETIIKLAADYLPEGGDVAILSASSTATNQNAWIEAAKKVLPEKFPKINLVATVYGDDDSAKSTDEAKGLLKSYPNLKAIIAPTTVGVVAAAQVVDRRRPDRQGQRHRPGAAVGVQEVHRQRRLAGRRAVEPDRPRLFRGLSRPRPRRQEGRGQARRQAVDRPRRRGHARRHQLRPRWRAPFTVRQDRTSRSSRRSTDLGGTLSGQAAVAGLALPTSASERLTIRSAALTAERMRRCSRPEPDRRQTITLKPPRTPRPRARRAWRYPASARASPACARCTMSASSLYPGQVTALIGENGAGKSTLVKILTGIYQPDAGTIALDGEPVSFPSAHAAFEHGITAIHQETVLFDDLTVAENIFLGHAPRTRFGTIDWRTMRANAREVLATMRRRHIDADARLKRSRHRQQASGRGRPRHVDRRADRHHGRADRRALATRRSRSSSCSIEFLKQEGKAILFISHKFDEIFRIADRYTVFRDGEMVGEGMIADTSQGEIVKLMVGRAVDHIFPKRDGRISARRCSRVAGLSHPTEFDDIGFELRKGEILGFYGLVGAGRSEVMQAMFGITRTSRGTITLDGKPIAPRSAADADRRRHRLRAGGARQAGRRHRHADLQERLAAVACRAPRSPACCRLAEEFALARDYTERLDLRASSLSQDVGTLSGGNQQKVVIAKWLATTPKVIILDEPTKGIDIGSKAAVHGFMAELVAAGPVGHHGLVRAAGDPRHVRPRGRHARRPHRRDLRQRRARRRDAGRRPRRGSRHDQSAAQAPRDLAGCRHRRADRR